MSEVFFQSIIEKLGSMELMFKVKLEAIELMLKVTDTGKEKKPELDVLKKEIKNIPFVTLQFLKEEKINQNKIANRIEHKHHLHKGIWIAICLFIICFLFAYGWMSCHESSKIFKANDIKYRYFKIRGNQNVLSLCKFTDSLYQKDEEKFRSGVEQGEQNLIEQANRVRLAGEKKKNTSKR